MGSINAVVDLVHEGDVVVITMQNPPVNALGHALREGLMAAFAAVGQVRAHRRARAFRVLRRDRIEDALVLAVDAAQVFAPFGGFADTCAVVDSRVTMPDIPGIGFEAKNALYAVMKPMI